MYRFVNWKTENMRHVIAIAACAALMAVYCLIGARSSGHPLDELIRMIGLIVATDKTWRTIMNAKTIDGPSRREP